MEMIQKQDMTRRSPTTEMLPEDLREDEPNDLSWLHKPIPSAGLLTHLIAQFFNHSPI
jgi:hypothetical protein